MEDSSAGAHGGSPRPTATCSHPHRAADGSAWLLLLPPPLPHGVGQHPPASTAHPHACPRHRFSTACCPVGPQGLRDPLGLGSPWDPAGPTTTPHALHKSEDTAGPSSPGAADIQPQLPAAPGAAYADAHLWRGHPWEGNPRKPYLPRQQHPPQPLSCPLLRWRHGQ